MINKIQNSNRASDSIEIRIILLSRIGFIFAFKHL